MNSKEDRVLNLFFNSSKYWHFDELLCESKLSRSRLSAWLNKFQKEGIIKRVKPKGKMPFYVRIFESKNFRHKKRLFALTQLTESGLLTHLEALPKAKVVIIFGSFTSYDWHADSDIDIFIYGDDDDFEQGTYELKLQRDIQVHLARDGKDLKRINKLLPYIFEGDFIKGSIKDLGVEIYAKA
jgi:predicted nucleotidyltransferase